MLLEIYMPLTTVWLFPPTKMGYFSDQLSLMIEIQERDLNVIFSDLLNHVNLICLFEKIT